MITLKPCPFCGARGRDLEIVELGCFGPRRFVVVCDNCSAKGPHIRPGVDTDGNFTKREATEAWNTRNGK